MALRHATVHLIVALGFAVLAIAWTFPLVLRLATRLPGDGIGDNAIFFWNFWWMRTARASGASFFHTSYLMAPAGADLTLHTHTSLLAFAGATLIGRFSVATALNVTTLISLSLNGYCAYLLAWRTLRQRAPAILAGVIFGTSPYIAAHLNGHFNLTAAWTLPLFALGAGDALRGSRKWAIFSGIVLAATAYIDYYYVVYEIALACGMGVLIAREWSVAVGVGSLRRRWSIALSGAIACDVAVMIVIAISGGFAFRAGPIRVAARDTFNPLQLLWVLIGAAIWVRFRPRVHARPREGWSLRQGAVGIAMMLGIFVLCSAPLLVRAILLLVSGQYVTQQYYWRSAPTGIDVLTLLLGNPFHALWGLTIRHVYSRLGIDLIESGAWLGIVPALLAASAVRRRPRDAVVQQWVVLGCVFFVWSLGSHVDVAGRNTAIIGPEALLRFVPIAANARMPGRAMVVVYLALAMLAATAVARARWGRSTMACAALAALVLADVWIAPFPLAPIACPPMYQVVRDRPEQGALVELPLGLGDGFGEITPVDHRMLVCQAIHGRPLVGGFLARLPRRVVAAYRADPLIATWLRLSGADTRTIGDGTAASATIAGHQLDEDDIAFVLLNRRTASPQLRDYVERVLPLTVVSQDEERTLFVRTPHGPLSRWSNDGITAAVPRAGSRGE